MHPRSPRSAPVLALELLALGTLALSARPAAAVVDEEFYRPIGWTADSASYVYEHGPEYREPDDDKEPEDALVVSARDGSTVKYEKEAYRAWLSQHPLAPVQATGPSSPDRKTIASVEGQKSRPTDGTALADLDVFPGKSVRCLLQRGTERRESARLTVKRLTPGAPTHSRVWIFASWSPDGRRVAWLFTVDQSHPSDGDFDVGHAVQAVIAPTQGPRIQIVGKGAPPATFAKVADALEKAGFTPTGQGTAEESRATTVVYSAKTQEAEAKRIAALMPGGATTGELIWKSPFDVIVALGASASEN